MKSLGPILLALCFLLAGSAAVHAQRIVYPDFVPELPELKEDEKSKILKFFQKMKHVRESVYGNVHATFEVTKSSTTQGQAKHSKAKYEYWAKDYRFYRVDITTLESSNAKDVGEVYRSIVRPEGAAGLIQKEPGGWFSLAHLADTKSGYDGLTSLPIYQTSTVANCVDGITLAEILFLKELNGYRKHLEHIQFDGNRCDCKISSTKTGAPYIIDFSFDVDAGVCLTLGSKRQGTDQVLRRKVENEYNFEKFRQIPARHRETYESIEDQIFKTMNFQTLDVDFQPIAMDVFAAPEKLHISGEAFQSARDGGLPIWGKLVLALGAGLFLLGIVLLFFRVRRKKKGPFARQEVGPTPAAVQ